MTGRTGVARPRDYLEFKIAQFMADVTGRPMSLEDDFFENGGTSLGALQLLELLAHDLGATLSAEDFIEAPNAQAVARLIRADGSGHRAQPSIVRIGSDESPSRLYLVHGRGGEVFAYEPLRNERLPVTVRAIRAVGCDGEATPLATFSQMAERYAGLILDDCPPGPVTVGGFCLGAGIALEVVRRLEGLGQPVDRLIAFDVILGGRTYAGPERAAMLSGRHPELAGLVKTGIPDDSFDLERDDWEHVAVVLEGLGRLPVGSGARVISVRLQLVGQIMVAWGDFRPAPVAVPVTVIYGDEYSAAIRDEAFSEWEAMSSEATRVDVDAVHERFFSSPNVAEALRQALGASPR